MLITIRPAVVRANSSSRAALISKMKPEIAVIIKIERFNLRCFLLLPIL